MRLLATRLNAIASSIIKRSFTPISLFSLGEQGAWYDPSDLSTLFQDSAGTTPVTAVGQPVGLMLDKRLGLLLGAEVVINGNFNVDTSWTKDVNWAISGGVATNLLGGGNLTQAGSIQVGKFYRIEFDQIGPLVNTLTVFIGASTVIPFTNSSIAGRKVIHAYCTGDTRLIFQAMGANTAIDNISVKELPGNHAFQATTTSRPILKQDVNGKYYLLFDGIDDGMQTSTIDFTATDKMTVFAGVNAPSSAVSIFLELSVNATSNDGSFYISDNEAVSGLATHRVRGTGTLGGGSTAATPDKLIGVWRFDTSAASSEQTNVRYNGTGVIDSIVGTTQTLNFGNYPLFIGRRAGVNLPFNGHLYGLITRGALSTDAQITSTEKWLVNKTGVTL